MSGYHPPDHPSLGKINKIQMDFIKLIKLKFKKPEKHVPFLFPPPDVVVNGLKPDVTSFYIKPVLVFAPHVQCPGIFNHMRCSMDGCGMTSLKPKEWVSNPAARYVHDLSGGIYFMTYYYKCSSCSYDKQGYEKLYRDLPDALKSQFNVQLSSRSAYTDQFISYICTSASSTSTLMDTVKSLGNIRCTRYLEKRWQYEAAVDFFQKHPPIGVTDVECVGFSSMDNADGYNEILHLDYQTVVDIFCDYVKGQEMVIKSIQDNMAVPFCVSMDTTKKIRKRTTVYTPGYRSSHVRAVENGMNFILGCDGTVISRRATINDSLEMVKPQLIELKLRADRQGVKVEYFVVDNCCLSRGTIQGVFNSKDADGNFTTSIIQDVKHLINRPLEYINKTHKLYSSFISDFHGAVTDNGRKVKVKGRNGHWANVEAPLDSGEVIWGRLVKLYDSYKESLLKGGEQSSSLFLKGFDQAFMGQKHHWFNCVKEVFDKEGKHYYEARADLEFHLYRGTNRNEAWHKKLNSIYPIRCGERLGDACLDAITVAHNLDHCTSVTASSFGGVDPAVFRVGNLPYLLRLMSLQGSLEAAASAMTYSDMCLVRASPEKHRTAIGIRDSADEQNRRDFGPLKNSTGNPTHKSSQNPELRGTKARPSLTERNCDHEAKRMKSGNHYWTEDEKASLLEIVKGCTVGQGSDSKVNWKQVHLLFCEKHSWAQSLVPYSLRSQLFNWKKADAGIMKGTSISVNIASSCVSSITNDDFITNETAGCGAEIGDIDAIGEVEDVDNSIFLQNSNVELSTSGMGSTYATANESQASDAKMASTVSNVKGISSLTMGSGNTGMSNPIELTFVRSGYSYAELQAVQLDEAAASSYFSEYEDKILLHLTNNSKYKHAKGKKNLDWGHIQKDYLDWCSYFTLQHQGKLKLWKRDVRALKNRYQKLLKKG